MSRSFPAPGQYFTSRSQGVPESDELLVKVILKKSGCLVWWGFKVTEIQWMNTYCSHELTWGPNFRSPPLNTLLVRTYLGTVPLFYFNLKSNYWETIFWMKNKANNPKVKFSSAIILSTSIHLEVPIFLISDSFLRLSFCQFPSFSFLIPVA
jgi:hypothetical protein